jgi:hypothetical protein
MLPSIVCLLGPQLIRLYCFNGDTNMQAIWRNHRTSLLFCPQNPGIYAPVTFLQKQVSHVFSIFKPTWPPICQVKHQLARLHLSHNLENSTNQDYLCFALLCFFKFKIMTGGTMPMPTCPLLQALFFKS